MSRAFMKDISWSSVAAGFITVLISYTGTAAIIFQAAQSAGATPAQLSSWMIALGLGIGVSCIGLSLYYRVPVVTSWSTPGAALLITSLQGVPMDQAIGVFMFSGFLVMVSGLTGLFDRVMRQIPAGIAAAMLAGILLRFGLNVFVSMQSEMALVMLMFATYLLGKRFLPRYAVILVLLLGVTYATMQGMLHVDMRDIQISHPVLMVPTFNWATLIGVGIPLFIVTMVSQNVPGIAVLRASGYRLSASPLMSSTGFLTIILAPFGCYSMCLAAISGAICIGTESHEDPARRYTASVVAGVFYLVAGVFGATIVALLTAFPGALIMALAGLALLGILGNSLVVAMEDARQREPALITFLVTASGMTLFGIGSAFWGIVAGLLAMLIMRWRKQETATP